MSQTGFETRYSVYGYDCDVRATYAHLPCQSFWTWITGKALQSGEPRKPSETLLKEWQLWCQLAWSWGITAIAVITASQVYASMSIPVLVKVPVFMLTWLLVVNRTRGLLHTFHYTNHGASIKNMRHARWIAKYFMSIPILHTAWDNYHAIHAKDHHSSSKLCTPEDPDEQFMSVHGFYKGMPENKFWVRIVCAPFAPKHLWDHLKFRLQQNFIYPGIEEVIPRVLFWLIFFGVCTYFEVLKELIFFYLFPLVILTQHASWVQHVTEHLWFARRPEDISRFVYYGSLTWGRFLGRPYPSKGQNLRHWARLINWWLLIFVVDIPLRLYAFMQDLSSHDFHHRSPKVNFWRITTERAAAERRPSKFGPMTETWSVWESLLIQRDHLCRDEIDPFGIYAWERQSKTYKLKVIAE